MSLPINQVLCGDCTEVLKGFPSGSVDLVVTDPPYAIGFMGKNWDKQLPPKQAFQEVFRVLKDGALAFVMSSPRQDVLWRMLRLLEECGFELRQSFLSWVYATGFPKSLDVSKGIDKKLGLQRNVKRTFQTHDIRANNLMEAREGKELGMMSYDETEPASELAKEWQGWKSMTGLKPALECILMVNKPFTEKTIVDQVLKSGTGAVNVDACRIPSAKSIEQGREGRHTDGGYHKKFGSISLPESNSRFPANLLVSDDALNDGKITGAGITGSGVARNKNREGYLPHNVYGERKVLQEDYDRSDIGSFSRYFDLDAWAVHHGFLNVAKAHKTERDEGLKHLKPVQKYYADGRGNSLECFGSDKREGHRDFGIQLRKNFHPTVKPVKLMAYLVELGCQRKGVVLDPFCGSGSTLVAAQKLGRRWVGIELDKAYFEIAKGRIAEACADKRLEDFIVEEEGRQNL